MAFPGGGVCRGRVRSPPPGAPRSLSPAVVRAGRSAMAGLSDGAPPSPLFASKAEPSTQGEANPPHWSDIGLLPPRAPTRLIFSTSGFGAQGQRSEPSCSPPPLPDQLDVEADAVAGVGDLADVDDSAAGVGDDAA